MKFDDVLSQWDTYRQSKKDELKKNVKSGKKLNAPSLETAAQDEIPDSIKSETRSPRAHPVDVWLRRYGVTDKDAEIEAEEQRQRLASPQRVKDVPVEDRIDLHGLSAEEAQTCLEAFVTDCMRRGVRKILIIHGKGNHSETEPVLQRLTRRFIERDPRLGMFGHPDSKQGGSGATWVIIKQGKNNSFF